MQVVDTLRRVPLFSKLPEDKLAWIAGQGEEIRLEPRTTIAVQGAPPDGFYVVLEGQTEWTRKVGGQDVFVEKLGNGSIFAELLLILDVPYPTTGRAIKQVRLFKLAVPSFWEMLCACPEVLRGILASSVERAELHESVSQQHAKLISLGTMAAGLAHELNNPAAAVGRSVEEAREVFRESSVRALKLSELEMSPAERALVAGLATEVAERSGRSTLTLDSLERSDLEDEVALWLEDRGVEEAWELSPTLVGAGLDADWLEELADRLSGEDTIGDVLAWLATEVNSELLLGEIQQASARISELVGAVKSYSHMDNASQKEADVHEGLENTLVILGHKLKKGNVRVSREYGDLPPVCAYGSELNQVWTNLIDNAIDAVQGDGNIKIRTARENDRVLVEISDDGPGIPEEIQGRIFEPFFTTKDVGMGTGLGLDVSYRIVIEELGGEIRVFSEPGDTRFVVRLPISPTKESAS